MSDIHTKIELVDMAEVEKLKAFLGNEMWAACCDRPRGLEITVTIPYGTPRGLKTLLLAMRQFWRSAKARTL